MLKSKIYLEVCKVHFTFVASNFTEMKDYKRHLTLLPHKWQVVGFVMLVVVVVCFVPFYFLQQQYSHELWPIYLYLAGDFVLSAALLMICLSKEKVEDEYIMSVRFRALTIVAIIFFIANVLSEMVYGRLLPFMIKDHFEYHWSDIYFKNGEIGRWTVIGYVTRWVNYLLSINLIQFIYILILKIMVRLGKGNIMKSYLLPHRYKKVGWWLLVVSALLIPVSLKVMNDVLDWGNGSPDTSGKYLAVSRVIVLLTCIAVFLVCMSKEEYEDEYIRSIRARVLAYFVIFYVIISFIVRHYGNIAIFAMDLTEIKEIELLYHIGRFMVWTPLAAILYAIVLKRVLSKNVKESSNEE